VPVCVGFGISKPEHAATIVRAGADGVIIGSKIVDLIESNLGNKDKMLADIAAVLSEIKRTLF